MTRYLIDISGDLEVLSLVGFASDANPTEGLVLPSWVPDWTAPFHGEPFGSYKGGFMRKRFLASGEYQHRCPNETFGQLRLHGRIIDEVELILDYAPEEQVENAYSHEPDCFHLHDVVEAITQVDPPVVGDVTERRVFNTLASSHYTAEESSLGRRLKGLKVGCRWKEYQDTRGYHTIGEDGKTPRDIDRGIAQSIIAGGSRDEATRREIDANYRFIEDGRRQGSLWYIMDFASFRRIAVTAERSLSLVPEGTIPGDLFAIVHGSDVSLMLRHVAHNEYYLVGTAFIENSLDGQRVTWGEAEADKLILI